MSGFNLSGEHNTGDYALGRGIVYLAERKNNKALGYVDVGNCTEFNLTISEETLEHKSSRSGLSETDKEVTISKKIEGNYSVDSVNFDNLARFYSASADKAVTQAVGSAIAEFDLIGAGDWDVGQWFDLTDGTGTRLYDVDITKLSVLSNATPLVLDTDFKFDSEMGRIFIKSTAVNATPATDALKISLLTAWSTTASVEQIQGLASVSKAVSLKFIAENPADDGSKQELQIPKTTVRANGDLALIGDDWQTIGFSFTIEKDETQPTGKEFLSVTKVK